MNTLRTLLVIFFLGIILGIFITIAFQSDIFYSFARWRSQGVMEKGFPFIMLNNIIVIALTLFGGVLFSLFEIKSYEKFPSKLYSFLDWLTIPLHKIFAIFDRRITSLKKPMKSCYFISRSFPLMVLFFNAFLLANLLFYVYIARGTIQNLGSIILIAFIEFFSIVVAALLAYEFTKRNLSLYESNNIDGFKRESRRFLYSRKNWAIFVFLSIILLASAYLEYSLIK